MTDAAFFEEALAQPPQPVPAGSGRQADVIVGHTTQIGEVDAATMEEQAAFSEPEWDIPLWDIPFDPQGMDMAFQGVENMLIEDDFFEFTFDDETDGGLEEESEFWLEH